MTYHEAKATVQMHEYHSRQMAHWARPVNWQESVARLAWAQRYYRAVAVLRAHGARTSLAERVRMVLGR